MENILQNITVITVILGFLGSILLKFVATESKITALTVKVTYLEAELDSQAKDLQNFEQQTLHYLERIESKLDSFIMGNNG